MAKDPVTGPVSHPYDPKPVPVEEVHSENKEVQDEMTALEADSAEELVAGLAVAEGEDKNVQLEAEAVQTYEYELRTELAMRPLDDVVFMAQTRGVGPVTGLPKEKIARMILRHEGFDAPEPPPPTHGEPAGEEDGVPRYSVRAKRAFESQQQ